jgi:uncharacterized protein YdhG (YjbR/CyaY superfamily)
MMKAYPQGDFRNIDEYIALQNRNVQPILELLRNTIKSVVPQAEEVISYRMPAFRFKGILVYFAANKNHIGFYPTGSGIEAFKHEFAEYKYSKGAVQFPLDKPLPLDLIKRIVEFRLQEETAKAGLKKKK